MPKSVLLPAQGLAVFRRDHGRLYAALDYGVSGGGHGHPDRLNLLLADGPRRWLDDMGTGSYVERTLHWYRSTLAHNAPLVDGRSQDRVDGHLDAYDERGDWGWVRASAAIANGVDVRRTLLVGPDYVVDRVEWRADHDVAFDLPMHVDAKLALAPMQLADAVGAGGNEDGFDFLTHVAAIDASAGVTTLSANASGAVVASSTAPPSDGPPCRAWVNHSAPVTWFRATAPAAPGQGTRAFVFARMRGRAGAFTSVWDTRGAIDSVIIDDDQVSVIRTDGTRDDHHIRDDRCEVRPHDESPITLRGLVEREAWALAPRADHERELLTLARGVAVERTLAEHNYRRSEQSWREAGSPTACVTLRADDARLSVSVVVKTPTLLFVPAGTTNPLDNERAEINGDGVQLHVQPHAGGDALAWLLVPDASAGGSVRVIALLPAADAIPVDATWRRTSDGYAIDATLPLATLGDEFALDVLVNETSPERERRRGQLVLSGARGEFVYLQGDRQDPRRFLRVRVVS